MTGHPGVRYPLRPMARPEVRDHDIPALPTDRLKRVALQILVDVARGDRRGAPLDDLAPTGDLRDCYKVYFDERGDRKPRYRLAYRLLPSGGVEAVSVEAVAIGERGGLAAYIAAARRLGRLAAD